LIKLNLSPKVVAPFVAGLVGFAVTWIANGTIDGTALTVLISTFVYGALGLAAPPVPKSRVKMSELVAKHSVPRKD